MREYFLWLAKFITTIVIIVFAVPVVVGLVGATQDALQGGVDGAKHKVAVVELSGEITSSKDVVDELYRQSENDSVKAIVLRIDSPGGAVGPAQEIYEAVRSLKAKKPIVVSMGMVAASGGLYAALGASKIYAQPGTLTGSIGVIMQLPNFRKIAEKVGVDMVTIKSGKFKDVGNSFRDMTPDEQAFLQSTVSSVADQFIQAVVDSRKLDERKVRAFADGRVLLGSQAKELGVIDGFGSVHDAAREALELANEKLAVGEVPHLVYPQGSFKDELKKLIQSTMELPILALFSKQKIGLYYLLQ